MQFFGFYYPKLPYLAKIENKFREFRSQIKVSNILKTIYLTTIQPENQSDKNGAKKWRNLIILKTKITKNYKYP